MRTTSRDRLASLVILILLIAVGASVFAAIRRSVNDNNTDELIGKHLILPSGVNVPSGSTVVVVARRGCPACAAAVPFLRRVAHQVAAFPETEILVAFANDITEEDREYAKSIGLPSDNALPLKSFGRLPLQTVPTVLVSDGGGLITYVAVGVPTDGQAENRILTEVLSALRASRRKDE